MGFSHLLFGGGRKEAEEEPSSGLQVTLVADGTVAVPQIQTGGGVAQIISELESVVGFEQAIIMRIRALAEQPALTPEEAESLVNSLAEQANQARIDHLVPQRRQSFWARTFRKGAIDSKRRQEIRRAVRS